ncbi:MAG TPA: c-type cytochrome [Longimicrobiales bacterium]
MRRVLGCVLAIAFVATAAACGGQKNNASGAAGTETTSAAQPAAPAATSTPAAAPAGPVTVPPNLPAGVTAAMIQEGNQIFHGAGLCQSCHGPDAKGTTLAPDLTMTTHLWVSDYPSYVKLITTGVPQPKQHPGPMPPKGGSQITDDQVKAVAAYEWSLSHPQGGK